AIEFRRRAGQNLFFLVVVIERSKTRNFFDTANSVQGVEITGIARIKLGRLQITRALISITKRVMPVSADEMNEFPWPVGADNATAGGAEKSPGELAQFARGFAGQDRQLPAAMAIDQTILKIDSDPGVSSLEKFLDLAEKRIVHKRSDGRASSSR